MANRIRPLEVEDVDDPEVRSLMEQAEGMIGDTVAAGIMARRPHIMKKFYELFGSAVLEDSAVDPDIMELMRYRCADVNECFY